MTVPVYSSGVQFDDATRQKALDLMARVVEHRRNGTTDQAPEQMRVPVAEYLDKELFDQEMTHIFRKVPLPIALSIELPNPGDYKAMRVVGRDVLITRGPDGTVNAMFNVCRHRGMKLVADGRGSARRFTCVYHAWSYDTQGCLKGVNAESTFGDVPRDEFSLKKLWCVERAGLIFVSLTPGEEYDIEEWLGEALPWLEHMDLANMYLFSTKYLDGPAYRCTVDGFLEGYHFASLHPESVSKTNYSNMAAFDAFGPHIRNSFALRTIDRFLDLPREEWDPVECLGIAWWLFPGVAIAGGWRQHTAVSIMLPGDSWEHTRTEQMMLLRQEPADEAEALNAQVATDFFYAAFRDEDYTAQTDVMRGLDSMANEEFIFGRNEPGVQHVHRTLAKFLDEVRPS